MPKIILDSSEDAFTKTVIIVWLQKNILKNEIMKNKFANLMIVQLALVALVMLFASCTGSLELATSWKNKSATVKSNPKIVVMAVGKNLTNKQKTETEMVAELKKKGQNAIASMDILTPGQKYDSAAILSILAFNKVDYILTNAIVSKTESEHYVPGETYTTPVTTTQAVNYYPSYNSSFYYYYGYQSGYYTSTQYETHTTEGYTVTEIEVLIESSLFDVSTSGLVWVAQSKAFTDQFTDDLFVDFAKIIVKDLIDKQMITPPVKTK
jgi:hypothetical protein